MTKFIPPIEQHGKMTTCKLLIEYSVKFTKKNAYFQSNNMENKQKMKKMHNCNWMIWKINKEMNFSFNNMEN